MAATDLHAGGLRSDERLERWRLFGLSSPGAEALSTWGRIVDRVWHLILPVACLTYGGLASLSRFARAQMLQTVRQDYIRTARAKGLTEKVVVFRHAFRNSLIWTHAPLVKVVTDALQDAGHEVHLGHPLKLAMISKAKTKTDRVDAFKLARLLRSGDEFTPLGGRRRQRFSAGTIPDSQWQRFKPGSCRHPCPE